MDKKEVFITAGVYITVPASDSEDQMKQEAEDIMLQAFDKANIESMTIDSEVRDIE